MQFGNVILEKEFKSKLASNDICCTSKQLDKNVIIIYLGKENEQFKKTAFNL